VPDELPLQIGQQVHSLIAGQAQFSSIDSMVHGSV
jgi:hypothetical protein